MDDKGYSIILYYRDTTIEDRKAKELVLLVNNIEYIMPAYLGWEIEEYLVNGKKWERGEDYDHLPNDLSQYLKNKAEAISGKKFHQLIKENLSE